MRSCVLDASAVLALLLGETGAEAVQDNLSGGIWSAVNYAEALTRLTELTGSLADTRQRIDRLELDVIPFDAEQAAVAASLRAATRACGLSLADRACLALAHSSSLPVLTADRDWAKCPVEIKMVIIR